MSQAQAKEESTEMNELCSCHNLTMKYICEPETSRLEEIFKLKIAYLPPTLIMTLEHLLIKLFNLFVTNYFENVI